MTLAVTQQSEISNRTSFLTLFPSIMLPMFLAIIDQSIVTTALPTIGKELGGVEHLSWIMVAYLVAATISAPVFGLLGDTFGRRRLMLVALSVVAMASLLCSVATSVDMLVAGRFAQGFGGGGLMTLSQALIGESIPPRERGRYQGYLASIFLTASTIGPVVGGVLSEFAGWQSIFIINLPLAGIAGVLVWRLPSHVPAGGQFRFDILGLLLFGLFVSTMLVAMEQLQNPAELSPPIFLALITAIVISLPTLIFWEGRAKTPLLPISLMRNPSIWRCDVLAACHGGCLLSLMTIVPIYLCVVQGVSPSQAGLLMLPMTFAIGGGALLTARIVSRTGHSAIFPSVGLVLVVISLVHLAWRAPDLSPMWAAINLGFTALCMGTVMNVVQVTVQSAAGPTRLGLGAASVQFSRTLGAALGTAIVATMIFLTLNLADPETAHMMAGILRSGSTGSTVVPAAVQSSIALAFQAGFLTIACFAAIAAPLAWTLPMRRIA